MCPQCGKRDSVLQSVRVDAWECRPELDGCGAVFDLPPQPGPVEHLATVDDAIKAMTAAIRNFEHDDHPLGQPSLIEIERRTAELLDVLKSEIGRLTTLFNE
jgi:hypothetical protein